MDFIEILKYKNTPLFYFGFVNLILGVIFILLTQLSSTQFAGTNAWYKPFKFAISIMLFSWSMAWYCYYLPSFNTNILNWVIITCLGFEIFYIAIQAARGQASHFNVTTPIYSALYASMGLAAVIVTLYTAYIGVLFFIDDFPTLPPAYLWGIRFGILMFVVFSFEGAMMGGRMSHTVGADDGGTGIPITNWSKQNGDLRIAHFIGMHALQVLPLLGYYLLKDKSAIFIASTLYGFLAFYTLSQALKGKPFHKF